MNKKFLLSALLLIASTTIVSDLRASAPAMSQAARAIDYSLFFDKVCLHLSAIQVFVNTCSTEAGFKERCLQMLADAYTSYNAAVAEAYNEQKGENDGLGNHAIDHYRTHILSNLKSLTKQAKVSSAEFNNVMERRFARGSFSGFK